MVDEILLKILVVDDDEIDRMAVKRALKKATKPIDIHMATSFTDATKILRSEQFDCLLFDYRLGGQSGLHLIQEIQNEGLSQAPIVMLSGIDDEAIVLNCLKEGAQDYLLKSEITTHSLMRAIRYAQERKQITLQMRFLAQHDSLTGLASRGLFIDSVKRAILRAAREESLFAIIFIDVDNFKSVNDTLGHEAGDDLLTTISHRIQSTIRRQDIVGRLGGDEFSILIEGVAQQSSLIKISQQLLNAVREPVIIYNKTIHTSISLGIATYPTCSNDASALIKCADLAMYKAKKSGRNNYCFYSDDLQQAADEYANLKIDLHNALARQEFELYYQPQIHSATGTIAGVEALIRWHHPKQGLVAPNDFISVAETANLINAIGDWVIGEACKQLKIWLLKYPKITPGFNMSINVSAHQIRQADLEDKIFEMVKHYEIPSSQVELELTESSLVDDIDRCTEKLNILSDHGILTAIDDFGTGFSSFRHLQQLPLKTLKIDKSFIDHICTVKKSHEIVKAMIAMARALDMTVVAEGVETAEQAVLLKNLNCERLQGYYFSKAVPACDLDKILANPSSIKPIPPLSDIQISSGREISQNRSTPVSIHPPPRTKTDNDSALDAIENHNKKLTILLVDDDDLDAKAVERMLRRQDDPPKLVRVINGIEALKLLRIQSSNTEVQPPFLVLLDLNMPKMGGLELLEEIRKDRRLQSSIIFVLTTSAADQDKVSAYSQHVAGYIVKSEAGPEYCHLSAMLNHYINTVSLLH